MTTARDTHRRVNVTSSAALRYHVAERVRRRGGVRSGLTLVPFVLPLVDDDVAVARLSRNGARARSRGASLGEKPVAEMATEIYLSVPYSKLYCA